MLSKLIHNLRVLGLAAGAVLLAACSSDSAPPVPQAPPAPPPPPSATFELSVSNLTNAQPLSPIAAISHDSSYRVFRLGEAASPGLEELAEGGSNAALLVEAAGDNGVFATVASADPVPPGASTTLRFTILVAELPSAELSVSSMLVNTNDAFSGINGLAIGDIAIGESRRVTGIAYDSGTEANTEQAIHIPGPVAGGEGFNAARDDRFDRVTMHSGIVGRDDGLADSDLDNQHRFDNPVLAATVTRID
ncbi:MAG: spondin domain-containing protein [Pseudomonadota bacterium]